MFVTEYLKDFNATQAAIRAGYSEKTADVIGYENLGKPQIKEAIEKAKKQILGDGTKDIIENVRFWTKMRDNEEAPESARLKASELLGRYRTMFTEKIETKSVHTIDMSDKSIDELKQIILDE